MKRIIRNIACQSLILLLVVQTLNLSMNSLDFYTPLNGSNSTEEQDYVDSMIEFVVENVLGYSTHTFHDKANADNFSRQQQNNVHFDLKWLPNSISFIDNHEIANEIINIVPKNDRIINLYFKEVPAKPPQVLSA
jgi:hypothetical protein